MCTYYVYTQVGDSISKYKVSYDENQLIKLMDEIIDNCSHITHQVIAASPGFFGLDGPDKRLIRDLEYEVIRRTYDRDGEEKCTLRYEFNEYKPPKLVDLIYSIRRGEYNSVNLLNSYNPQKDLTLQEQIIKLCKELGEYVNNGEELGRKLALIDRMKADQELNKCQQPTSEYYKKLVSLVNVELVASYDIKTINEVLSFLNINITDSHMFDQKNSFVRILKKSNAE